MTRELLNPFRHGEVFVLDDGMECDMDLGTYERMLDQNMARDNFSTSGQIFSAVLEKERRGGFLGRDVQMIPHVTGEVKSKLRHLAVKTDADVVFIEIGGTVGDVENAYYIEALRQLAFEEGPDSACWVALTYIIQPPALGEQKSKAAQLGIKQLTQAGIQPHIIACRAINEVTTKAREKIALYSSVPLDRVFSMHDCESVYVIPEMIREAWARRTGCRHSRSQGQAARRGGSRCHCQMGRLSQRTSQSGTGNHHRRRGQIYLSAGQLRVRHQGAGTCRHARRRQSQYRLARSQRSRRRQSRRRPEAC